jgi:hypothetical protein
MRFILPTLTALVGLGAADFLIYTYTDNGIDGIQYLSLSIYLKRKKKQLIHFRKVTSFSTLLQTATISVAHPTSPPRMMLAVKESVAKVETVVVGATALRDPSIYLK